jgi:hypothetical protein
MITIVARITHVVTGHDTATLLQAIDDDDLEIKLEVPPAQARMIVPGQVLVLQWSAHTVPALTTPAPQLEAPAADPIDHEFDLRSEPPASPASARSIIDEFNTLLGTARRKG